MRLTSMHTQNVKPFLPPDPGLVSKQVCTFLEFVCTCLLSRVGSPPRAQKKVCLLSHFDVTFSLCVLAGVTPGTSW